MSKVEKRAGCVYVYTCMREHQREGGRERRERWREQGVVEESEGGGGGGGGCYCYHCLNRLAVSRAQLEGSLT